MPSTPAQVLLLGAPYCRGAAVAHVLQRGGLAADVDPDQPETPTARLRALSRELLDAAGAEWTRADAFDLGALDSNTREDLLERARTVFEQLDARGSWCVYDPLLALTLPAWRPLLRTPIAILVHRDPLVLAASVEEEQAPPAPVLIALWEAYTCAAIEAAKGMPGLSIDMETLDERPRVGFGHLRKQLARQGGIRLRTSDMPCGTRTVDPVRAPASLLGADQAALRTALARPLKSLSAIRGTRLSTAAKATLSSYASEVDARRKLSVAEDDLNAQVNHLKHAQNALNRAQKELAESRRRADRDRGEAERNRSQIASLREQLERLRARAGRANEEVARKKAQIEQVRAEVRQLTSLRRAAARAVRQRARARVAQLETLRSEFRNLLDSWRWRIGNSAVRIAERLLRRPRVALAADRIEDGLDSLIDEGSAETTGTPEVDSNDVDAIEVTEDVLELPSPLPSLEVVVCVHDALEDVRRCLESVTRNSTLPYRMIVVDDGSSSDTATFLREFTAGRADRILIRTDSRTGYTRSANRGLTTSEADWVVLLNSDTVVPPQWLELLVHCGARNPHAGLLGPLSNAATWQSVPERYNDAGGWADNPLPETVTAESMARAVRQTSAHAYPSVPLLNGFCLAIRRSVIERIGLLDEASFPDGYGEENDYCIRATEAGFDLAVVDDLYVYHAKSRSYGDARRTHLAEQGKRALAAKYDAKWIDTLTKSLRDDSVLAECRRRATRALDIAASPTSSRHSPSILFVLPTRGGGGGAHSVVQEALGMRELGAQTHVAIRSAHLTDYRLGYAEIWQRADDLFVTFDEDTALVEIAVDYDVIVGTIYTSIEPLAAAALAYPEKLAAYYVQDYEPFFFDEGTAAHARALESYTRLPDVLLFAKTDWLCNLVHQRHGVRVHKVLPSLDQEIFHPNLGRARPEDRVRMTAMIRPRTPRRGAARTMEALFQLSNRLGDGVDVTIFGCEDSELESAGLPTRFSHRNLGVLTRHEVADLLRSTDVFVDLSEYQAFGRTGLEAMACGCVPILPSRGGVSEYAVHDQNALLANTRSTEACVDAMETLARDRQLLARLRRHGLLTAAQFSIRRAALSELLLFKDARAARQEGREPPPKQLQA